MTHTTDERAKIAELIKEFRFAMLTTRHADGRLVARPLTIQEAEFDGDLWFLVSTRFGPAPELAVDSQANVSLSSNDSWVSISGTAQLVADRGKIEELWNPVVEAWFPEGPDDPSVGVLKFTAESAEYWDSPGGKIATAFSFVKSKITGEPLRGDNATVQLSED